MDLSDYVAIAGIALTGGIGGFTLGLHVAWKDANNVFQRYLELRSQK
jgi:hypothetical protein